MSSIKTRRGSFSVFIWMLWWKPEVERLLHQTEWFWSRLLVVLRGRRSGVGVGLDPGVDPGALCGASFIVCLFLFCFV